MEDLCRWDYLCFAHEHVEKLSECTVRQRVYLEDTEGSGEGLCREEEDGAEGRVFLFPSPSLLFTAAVVPLGFSLFSGEMLVTSASADARMLPESRDSPPRQRSCPVAM